MPAECPLLLRTTQVFNFPLRRRPQNTTLRAVRELWVGIEEKLDDPLSKSKYGVPENKVVLEYASLYSKSFKKGAKTS